MLWATRIGGTVQASMDRHIASIQSLSSGAFQLLGSSLNASTLRVGFSLASMLC
jgi:hypothetical protein